MSDDNNNNNTIRPSAAHQREIFYVGGHYQAVEGNAHILQGQMYVERLIPRESTEKRPSPIVFIHGATRSGMDWITKPDGQPGWASYFLSRGFECYVVDLPFRGRSPCDPSSGETISFAAESYEKMFTACKELGDWPQAKLHTQWPGSGRIGDPVFDNLYASSLQMIPDTRLQETASQAACAALLDRIGKPAILLGHSAGGPVPWLAADARPALVGMIINLEPAGPPFTRISMKPGPDPGPGPAAPFGLTTAPITYDPPLSSPEDLKPMRVPPPPPGPDLLPCSVQAEGAGSPPPPPPRRLANLRDTPVLVVTAQASYHAQYDWGTVRFLEQAGVARVDHLRTQDKGMRGNGHLMFMERNSDEIAAEIVAWIEGVGVGGEGGV